MRFGQIQVPPFLEDLFTTEGIVFILGNVSVIAAVGFAYEMGSNLVATRNLSLPEVEFTLTDETSRELTRKDITAYAAINSRNIFGAPPAQETAPEAPQPATNLKLRLVGTNISSTGSPFAIIEDTAKRDQELFELNESIFKQAKLIEISPESVKIERGGKIEVLVLEDSPTPAGASDTGVASLNDDQTEFSVSEAELEGALSNLPRLLSQARAVPYFRNGKSIGMRLFAIRRDSLYEKLGLRNGDIVKSVNENSLSDPAQALKLFEQLKTERSVRVTLERGGVDMSLSYNIN